MLDLCDFGCVVTTAELLSDVRQDSVVDIYQASRNVVRVRRGLYACAHLTAQELMALRCGGVLDCVWALDAEGLDVSGCGIDLTPVHVRFRRGDHWARSRITTVESETGTRIVAHWHEWRSARPTARASRARSMSWSAREVQYERRRSRRVGYAGRIPGVVPLTHVPPSEALAQALVCVAPDQALRLAAEAEASGALSASDVNRIIEHAPRRTRDALRRVG